MIMNKLTKLVENIVESKVRLALEEGEVKARNKKLKNKYVTGVGKKLIGKYYPKGVPNKAALKAGRQDLRSRDPQDLMDTAARHSPKTFTDPKTGNINPSKVKFSQDAEQGKVGWLGKESFKKLLKSRATNRNKP